MKRIIFVGLCLTQVVYLPLHYMTFGSFNVMAVADRLVGAGTALFCVWVLERVGTSREDEGK